MTIELHFKEVKKFKGKSVVTGYLEMLIVLL